MKPRRRRVFGGLLIYHSMAIISSTFARANLAMIGLLFSLTLNTMLGATERAPVTLLPKGTQLSIPSETKLTSGQRRQFEHIQALVRRYVEARDQMSREYCAKDFLTSSAELCDVLVNYEFFWRVRAIMALEAHDRRAGMGAAQVLMRKSTPADTKSTSSILTELSRRGWISGGGAAIEAHDCELRSLRLLMIYIAPGEFSTQGGIENSAKHEDRTVKISREFWMGQTEITNAQWRLVMGQSVDDFKEALLPKVGVTWVEAHEFCQKLTEFERQGGRLPEGCVYTLPSEAQWEYACRAGCDFSDVEDITQLAWYADNSSGHLHAVGEKKPNAWGLLGMLGNASEWCSDHYVNTLSRAEASAQSGPAEGTLRVARGGNYGSLAINCRPDNRGRAYPEGRDGASEKIGFRIVLTYKDAP